MANDLTTTSYAILGLLSLRSWSTYELAEQMRRALGHFWPRAESGIYREPKKLVQHGLARATDEMVGERPRTRYTITAKGKRALAAWVPTPGAGPVIEFEQLVKVFFAEQATKAELLATLAGVRAWVEDQAVATAGISREYLDGHGGYPERLPWLILVGRFIDDIEQTVDRWAEWAIGVVERWPDDMTRAEPDRDALVAMAAHNDEILERVRGRAEDQPSRRSPSMRLTVQPTPSR
jgi:DNA-binding PadR family transcriptional regulator